MDIELVRNFRKLINANFNELIVSVIEQYNTEIDRLNEVIVSSTALVKEKEDLIGELQKELEDTKFDEDNFNNVSLIHNLNKQVDELTSQNKLLNTSLEARRKNDKLRAEQKNKVEQVEVNENNTDNVEDNHDNVDDNAEDNIEDNDVGNDDNVENNDDNGEDNVENNTDNVEEVINNTNANQVAKNNDEDGDNDDEDEETVEVEEIEVNDKSYYVKDGKIYNKKKNGDMGSKPVGEMVDGEPIIAKKEKKEKKDKKDKKEKKNKKNNN